MVLDGDSQHRGDVVVTAGADHGVRGVGQVAAAGPQQVGRGLPAGAQPAYVVVEEDVLLADHVAKGRQRGLAEGGGGHGGRLDRGRGVQAEGHLDQAAGALGQVGRGARGAPALGVHLAQATGQRRGGGVRRHVLQCDT